MDSLTIIASTLMPLNCHNPRLNNVVKLPIFSNLEDLHEEKIHALSQVDTDYCVIVNEGDSLPYGICLTLEDCIKKMSVDKTNICYTDVCSYRSNLPETKAVNYHSLTDQGMRSRINQFAVMRTSKVKPILEKVPNGLYWTEALVFKLLEMEGLSYIRHAGCIWNPESNIAINKDRVLANLNSFTFCADYIMKRLKELE